MPPSPPFDAAIAEEIWDLKYRLRSSDGTATDCTVDETFWRVAKAAAKAEKGGKRKRAAWAEKFHSAISDFGFLPAGRILAGAGTERDVTLFNCFVMGRVPDDLAGIFTSVKQAALTMQAGGGIGQDFSTLRPKGALVRSIGADASGPVSFMDLWDAMCRTIMSAGARRGAMMGTMRVDHPDIEDFISAKADAARLRNFNLSVLVTDEFMAAVHDDAAWQLKFEGKVYKTVAARKLWERIMRSTYDYAEPGVIFIDRINTANNLNYCEEIFATNPCGEQPLPSYGACLLGSLNLTRLVTTPFEAGATIPLAALQERTRIAVRFLDNVIDISNYPLKKQRKEAKNKRRIGLGITGLANALIMTGHRYDSENGRKVAETWMATIQNAAYEASAEIAKEKGAFPAYDCEAFLNAPNVQRLQPRVRKLIAKHGVRNGCLTSIAPTGTISLFAGNVSSGIEPVFDFHYQRRVLSADGKAQDTSVEDYAYKKFCEKFGKQKALLETFVRAEDLPVSAHLKMQAVLQPHVDSAISKTINCAEDIPFDDFKNIYAQAYKLGLKGCTTYRPNKITGAVLSHDDSTATVETDTKSKELAALNTRESDDVVYMAKPLERSAELEGTTYKLKWPNGGQAVYITINDITLDGRRRPFEIFINTRNLEHYAWTVALTRMISAVFRRGGDVSFVADELKAIFDPQGGCWVDGKYVPSMLAAIGDIIENHMRKIGFMPSFKENNEAIENKKIINAELNSNNPHPLPQSPTAKPICQRCGAQNLIHQEGCLICRQCGFSQCK